jgi:Leucine-rich repeat (LRR) protein
MPWSALPEGILTRVLSKLDEGEEFGRIIDCRGSLHYPETDRWAAARLVCRDWASAVPTCVRRLSVKHVFLDSPLTRNMCVLERLTWVDGLMSSREGVPFALPSLRELKLCFSIPGASWVFDSSRADNARGFRLLAERFPSLESLEVDRVPFGRYRGSRCDLSPLAPLPLRSLTLTYCQTMPKMSIVGLESLTGLTSFSLWDRTLTELPPGVTTLARLESLSFWMCHGLKSLQQLAEMQSLTALLLLDARRLDVATIPPRIRSLAISYADMSMAKLYSAVGGSLTSLDMDDCKDTNGGLPGFQGFPGIGLFRGTLKSLTISNSRHLSRRDIAEIGALIGLETLDVSMCGPLNLPMPNDDLASIEALGNLSALKILYLGGTSIVSLPGDAGVLARLSSLQRLSIDGLASDVEALRATLPRLE